MNNELTFERYQALNRTFRKELIFHLGSDAGFYSEFNNMILAIIYCLQYHIKFSMYSLDANFKYKEGWRDFFMPFCDEISDSFHHKYNMRYEDPFFGAHGFERLKILYWRMRHKHTYLTSDLFFNFRNVEFERMSFSIPELGLAGNLREIGGDIINNLIYRFNEQTKDAITNMIDALNLPDKYVGFHIRGGDKFVEHKLEQCIGYISKAEQLTTVREAFVLTDDYLIIEALRNDFPHWCFYTLTGLNERGYFHAEFQKLNMEDKKENLVKLFASMEVLRNADLFVGTYSSNPGMFLGMCMDENRVYGIDFDKWLLW